MKYFRAASAASAATHQELVSVIDQSLFSLAGFVQVFLIVQLFGIHVLGDFSGVWYGAILLETILNAAVLQGAVVSEVTSKKIGSRDLFGRYLLLSGPLAFSLTIPVTLIMFESPSVLDVVSTFLFLMLYHLPSFARKTVYLIFGREHASTALCVTVCFVWGRVLVLFVVAQSVPLADTTDILFFTSLISGCVVGFAIAESWMPNAFQFRGLMRSMPDFLKDSKSFSLISQGLAEWVCFMGPAYAITVLYGSASAGVYVSSRTLGTSLNLLSELFSVSKLRDAIRLRGISFRAFICAFRGLLLASLMGAMALLAIIGVYGDTLSRILFGGVSQEYGVVFLMLGVIVQVCYIAFMVAKTFLRVNGHETVNTAFSMGLLILFASGFWFEISFIQYYLFYASIFFIVVTVLWLVSSRDRQLT